MTTATPVLVMAKAPIPGLAKTRLGAAIGNEAAADLAAAALLDTLEVCTAAFENRYLALAGDLSQASRGAEIVDALAGWRVAEQRGTTFGGRLAHAHAWVAESGSGPVVQVGMDTPHLSLALLRSVADGLADGAEVVIGPAEDGGWWVLGLAEGRSAAVLAGVPMSVPQTYQRTVEAFDGHRILEVATVRDVDTVEDAVAVAVSAPQTRFARSWDAHAARFGSAVTR